MTLGKGRGYTRVILNLDRVRLGAKALVLQYVRGGMSRADWYGVRELRGHGKGEGKG